MGEDPDYDCEDCDGTWNGYCDYICWCGFCPRGLAAEPKEAETFMERNFHNVNVSITKKQQPSQEGE